jgi:mono/diheme cytochrome c family protein
MWNRLVLFWLLGSTALACSREPKGPVERGRATFVRSCSGCHGLDGKGSATVGPAFQAPPRDLTDPSFHGERTDEQLLFVLRNGKGNMPPFAALMNETQLRDVVAYVRSLATKPE